MIVITSRFRDEPPQSLRRSSVARHPPSMLPPLYAQRARLDICHAIFLPTPHVYYVAAWSSQPLSRHCLPLRHGAAESACHIAAARWFSAYGHVENASCRPSQPRHARGAPCRARFFRARFAARRHASEDPPPSHCVPHAISSSNLSHKAIHRPIDECHLR